MFPSFAINENPSVRAVPKILRAQVSEHSAKFFEQFERWPNFSSTVKSNGITRYPYLGPLLVSPEWKEKRRGKMLRWFWAACFRALQVFIRPSCCGIPGSLPAWAIFLDARPKQTNKSMKSWKACALYSDLPAGSLQRYRGLFRQ